MDTNREITGFPSIDKPWLHYYSSEAINATLPECTVYEYLLNKNSNHLDDIAIIYFNRKITYRELFQNIDQATAAFSAIGVRSGDIVTVALPSIPEALYSFYALNRIGAVANMIHPLAGEKEICSYLNEVNSQVLVMYTGTYAIVKDSLDNTSIKNAIVVSPADSLSPGIRLLYHFKTKEPKLKDEAKFIWYNNFIKRGKNHICETVKRSCYDVSVISHTGGTTGEPKGVMLSDYNFNSEVTQIVTTIHYERQESFLAVLPPFINYSFVHSMVGAVNSGLITVLIPKYEPLKLAEYIKKYHVKHINSIPVYCEALLRIRDIGKYRFPDFGYLFYGGEAMARETEEEINVVLANCGIKHKLQKGLGMTELTGAATKTTDAVNELGSVGIPLPKMNCKIVSVGSEVELKYGEEGEVCITGPTLMLGYYKKEKQTNEIIKVHKDGLRWLHTGDLGFINEHGVLFLTGRIKRIIMTKGSDGNVTKMFPDRIEKVLSEHPAVDLCCVIGVADEERINYPKAFIVLNNGYTVNQDLTKEICSFCLNKLPGYMIPETIEYLTEMPRTSRGKIDFRALENLSKEG